LKKRGKRREPKGTNNVKRPYVNFKKISFLEKPGKFMKQ